MRYEKIIMGQSRCEEALQVVPALYHYKCNWCGSSWYILTICYDILINIMHFIFLSDIDVSVCVDQVYCYLTSCYINICVRWLLCIGVSLGKGQIE